MALSIRRAEERDLPRILELYEQLALHGGATPPGQWRSLLPAFKRIQVDRQQQLVVLEDGGRVVGTLALIIVPNLSHGGAPWSEVENVVVEESVRGKGYGRALMEWAENEAKRQGCYKMQLQSHALRQEAHKFYERLGFGSPARGFRKYYKGDG
ncbi:MAG: GNAT family N-acetyltransferase [Chloroflexi bacterium]|nr:GNAT family N-acetyltransferase [Chloroflexota bacterium]